MRPTSTCDKQSNAEPTGALLPSMPSFDPSGLNEETNLHDEEKDSSSSRESNRLSNASSSTSTRFQRFILTFTGHLEGFFYKWGFTVATRPYQSIMGSLVFTLICSMGLMNFTYEDKPDKLLIPQSSPLAYDTDWLRNNFPSPVRYSGMMLTADNVLVPEVMMKLMDIQERIEKITVKGLKWDQVCFKLPITKSIPMSRRRKRDISVEDVFADDFFNEGHEGVDDSENATASSEHDPYYDPFLSLHDDLYCPFIESLDEACWQITPLELWGFNRTIIKNLTHEAIVDAVNNQKISPIFGRPKNFTAELGGTIVKNEKGQIIKATSILVVWSVAVNKTALRLGQAVRDDGTGELADDVSLGWELEYVKLMEEYAQLFESDEHIGFYYASGRSFGDIYKYTVFNDLKMVFAGYIIMFMYVSLMLGRFNMIEQRPFLSLAGILCAALAGLVTCGICSAFGLSFGNVNKVLPFLLLGIGVDDMFVIMQCWKNLYPSCLTQKYKEPIPVRIGKALKTAGASITVTSLTDMAAFAIGSTTLLPGLKSFCVYAAVGIVAIFIFQVTLFVACLAIDQKRLEERRHAFFYCIKYNAHDFIPNKWSQQSYIQIFFEKYMSKAIFTPLGKVSVFLITATFFGVNLYGNLNIRQEFDPMWFLAQDSHLVKYIDARKIYYPNSGFNGYIVGDHINWTSSFQGFEDFQNKMLSTDSVLSFETWYEDFKQYSNRNFNTDIPRTPISEAKFQKYLGKFLFSRIGSKYRLYFKAENGIECGQKLSTITISMMPFKFRTFRGRDEHIPGMNEVKSFVKEADIKYTASNGRVFPWSSVFVSWETDEIITDELYRNVCLSLISVLITIFFLLFDLRTCLFCGLCVVLTVIDVGGAMYYWGMSIDTISVIANVVAIGLCVDYAAHIGLAFLTSTGTKNERATKALRDIGPAVLNGGFSTFLGIVLLANSESHALQSFFKVLSAVVFFGLFHGLVFLPVLLSVLGPSPYPGAILTTKGTHSTSAKNSEEQSKLQNQSELQVLTTVSEAEDTKKYYPNSIPNST